MQDQLSYESWDLSKVTTIGLFHGDATDQQNCDLVSFAHQHSVRVVISAEFPMNSINDDETIAVWIEDKLADLETFGFDGLNFDNEQLSGTADIVAQRIHEVRVALGPVPSLSFDTSIYPNNALSGYDFKAMAKDVDFFLPMGYDMPWNCVTASGNSPIGGLQAGLDEYQNDLGISSSQLILGLPWYGWRYSCADGTAANTTTACTLPPIPDGGNWLDLAAQVGLDAIITDKLKFEISDSSVHIDGESGTKFFTYVDGGLVKQYWYDDAETLAAKYGLQNKNSLLGVGIWTVDMCVAGEDSFVDMWEALPALA